MPAVSGFDVADFLGRGDDVGLVALAADQLPLVTAFVRSYTRGNGFVADVPNGDVAAVIVTATARLVTNPTSERRQQIGDYGRTPHVDGWTLPELAVLHRYRRRTA